MLKVTQRAFALIALSLVAISSSTPANAQVFGDLFPGSPGAPGYGAPGGPPGYPGSPGYDHGGPGRGGPGRGGPDRGGPGRGFQDEVRVSVGRLYQGLTRLDVNQFLARELRGRVIEEVVVRMSSPDGRSRVTFLESGRFSGPAMAVQTYIADYEFPVRRPGARTSLELQLDGSFYVHEITAFVSGGSSGGRPPVARPVVLTERVNQTYRGSALIDVDYLMGLHQYRGYRIARVTVRANSVDRASRGASAELLVNGYGGHSIPVGRHSQELVFYPNGGARMGHEINRIAVRLRGDVRVDSVTVELQR